MSATISRAEFARLLVPAINTIIGDSYEAYPEVYKQVFDVRQSDQAIEELLIISGLGLMENISEGGVSPSDRMRQLLSVNFAHAKYGKMLSVTQEMIDDGKAVKIVARQAKEFKKSAMETKNKVAIDILNNATVTNLADGVPLVSISHPSSAGNQSNRLAVDADLSEASIEQAYIEMRDIRDDRGVRIQVMPKKLVVPRALCFEVDRILESDKRYATADNDANVLKMRRIIDEVVVVDHITDADAYYFLTNVSDGLIMFERQALTIDSEPHFAADAIQFKAKMRFSVGVGDWRGVFASPGV